MEFDSQRPYPSLDDFGISVDAKGTCSSKAAAGAAGAADHNCSSSDSTSKMDHGVTVVEIRPIAAEIPSGKRSD